MPCNRRRASVSRIRGGGHRRKKSVEREKSVRTTKTRRTMIKSNMSGERRRRVRFAMTNLSRPVCVGQLSRYRRVYVYTVVATTGSISMLSEFPSEGGRKTSSSSSVYRENRKRVINDTAGSTVGSSELAACAAATRTGSRRFFTAKGLERKQPDPPPLSVRFFKGVVVNFFANT